MLRHPVYSLYPDMYFTNGLCKLWLAFSWGLAAYKRPVRPLAIGPGILPIIAHRRMGEVVQMVLWLAELVEACKMVVDRRTVHTMVHWRCPHAVM